MNSLIRQIQFYLRVLRDRRTPRHARLLLLLALAYLLLPQDLIPDFLPVAGWLDDASVATILIWLSLKCVPSDVLRGNNGA